MGPWAAEAADLVPIEWLAMLPVTAGLEQDDLCGPFQPKPFCDSVKGLRGGMRAGFYGCGFIVASPALFSGILAQLASLHGLGMCPMQPVGHVCIFSREKQFIHNRQLPGKWPPGDCTSTAFVNW